jgi:hypothetical protein
MKTYVIALLVLGLTTISYSQDKMDADSKNGNMSMENLHQLLSSRVLETTFQSIYQTEMQTLR